MRRRAPFINCKDKGALVMASCSQQSGAGAQGQPGFDESQHFEDIFAQFFGGGRGAGAFRGGFGGGFGGFRAKGPDMQARIR